MHSFSRPLLSAVIFSFFAVFTLNPTPVSASPPLIPPTHYQMDTPYGIWSPVFTGLTPRAAAAAAAATAYYNSLGGLGRATLQGCSMTAETLPGSDFNHIYCDYEGCNTATGVCVPAKIFAAPRCGPQFGATWNGTQYYCQEAPEPGCDDSCD